MKVTLLGMRGFPNVQGGVEAHCEGLAIGLAKLGCDITVFTRKPYSDPFIKEHMGVRLVALPTLRGKRTETLSHTFIGIFATWLVQPEILHLHGIGPALIIPFAKALGLRVVLTSHGSNYKHLKWGYVGKIIFRVGEYLGVKFADEIIAISPSVAAEIREIYGRDVTVIKNGMRPPGPISSEKTLARFGLSPGRYVLSVGRLVPEKGFVELIAGFQKAHAENMQLRGGNWKVVIVGRADHESSYNSRLKQIAARDANIILTGYLTGEALAELYTHAGLFALASYYEGLPIALLEAWSYGCSCIVSDIPGNRNVPIEDRRFFPVGSIAAISAKIQELASHPFTAEERKRQRRVALAWYDWDRVAMQTLKVYRKALKSL